MLVVCSVFTLNFYWLVFRLFGAIVMFSPYSVDVLHGWVNLAWRSRPPKQEICMQFRNISAPRGVSLARFNEIFSICVVLFSVNH